MSIRIILTILFSLGLAAASVYVYTLLDPRLDIILLKNEEIMRLDNKIADLMEENAKMSEQVSSISTVVKSNEKDSGKINDEYKVCLRQSKRLKKNNRLLRSEVSDLKAKNKIMQEYVQVKNDVTAMQEQIDGLKQKKQQLTEQLGDNANMGIGVEGGSMPHQEAGDSLEPPDVVAEPPATEIQ